MARQLTETAVTLIVNHIKNNIDAALADMRALRTDNDVTTEPPESYFIYPKAKGYKCPAIFVIDTPDQGTDFRQVEKQANFIDALMNIDVSVKIEDRDRELLTKKGWRYQAVLHQVLDLTRLASSDGKVTMVLRVRRIKPSGVYTYANDEEDSTASFFLEYLLNLEVEYFENF